MTILEEIGFRKKSLPKKLRQNLVIDPDMTHYPNNPHSKYYQWNWCRDEFNPPLAKPQINLYINNPLKYQHDFILNLKLYILFCQYLNNQIAKTEKLSGAKKLSALLSLLFLFQAAMDNHYSKFDNPLDLEEDETSPLGHHYSKVKKIITQVANKKPLINKIHWIEEKTLYLLDKKGRSIINNLHNKLNKKQLNQLNISYKALQVYINLQQQEEKLFFGKNQDGIIYKTGYLLWQKLQQAVNNNLIECLNQTELLSLLNGDPIYGTRKILVDRDRFFNRRINKLINQEIKKW